MSDRFSQLLAARFRDTQSEYAKDPVLWVGSNGEEVTEAQASILTSVRDNRYTAVHSAHDLGKSFVASRAIAWWIETHPPGSAFVVSTAPSSAQVSAIMWREVSKLHAKAGLKGKINRAGYPQWYLGSELVGYGRKPADYEESAFQGIHAEFVLIVIDEACGVAQHLYDAVDSLATNENARVLAIGNPDDPGSHFARVCQPDSGWNVIHLDALRSPNITEARVIGDDPSDPKFPLLAALMEAEQMPYSTEEINPRIRPMLVNEMWIEERIARWANVPKSMLDTVPYDELLEKLRQSTSGSALFSSKVRGIFPTSATDGVIPLGWVQRAIERWHDIRAQRRKNTLVSDFVLGIDVARTGDDQTVFAHRYGGYVKKLERFRLNDTTEIADRAAAILTEPRSTGVVDVIGIGAGVYDLLRRYQQEDGNVMVGTPVVFNAAARTPRKSQVGGFDFLNDRAAAWWNLRELLDPSREGGSHIALPDDDELVEELIAPKYRFNVGARMVIESKEEIKKRIGRSTDSADAVIQAFWVSGDHHQAPYHPWSSPVDPRALNGSVIPYEGVDVDFDVGSTEYHFAD